MLREKTPSRESINDECGNQFWAASGAIFNQGLGAFIYTLFRDNSCGFSHILIMSAYSILKDHDAVCLSRVYAILVIELCGGFE